LTLSQSTRRALAGACLLAGVLLVIFWLAGSPQAGRAVGQAARSTPLVPPPTAEPLVPTSLPSFRPTATPRAAGMAPTAPVLPTPASASAGSESLQAPSGPARARVGAALAAGQITDYDWGGGAPGWYLNWHVIENPPPVAGMRFVQMVRTLEDSFYPDLAVIRRAVEANRGSLWLIGNEPDVPWQDNATPEQYAASYDTLYRAIKEADPTAQVAIGGVSQPTPLRMAYLDRILDAYEAQFGTEMPVDVWNVHAFILREERGSWGVGIPPGMDVDQGALYEIGDHADMEIFRKQIADFRRWMAERGLRNKPLIVTEYSILMPASYGFPPDVVANFLADTFDFFLTARDPATGYPADDNRLVQAFNWFSVADKTYPTSNLFDPQTGAVTPAGEMFKAYVAGLP
jgi:hypothetical protein